MKRTATKEEKALIEAILEHGCVICGMPAQFHHITGARPQALAIGLGL